MALLAVILSTLAVAAALLFAARADALIHRGHVFEGTLETSGANKLSGPSAVAVNDGAGASGAGDSYVLDKGNNRVVRFGPKHEFLEAWGAGVNGGTEYERCKVAAECKAGIAGVSGAGKPKFEEPVAIAVDNAVGSPSVGDVYVVPNRTWRHALIYKFDFEGNFLGVIAGKPEEKEELWPIDGVAVDNTGKVWVDREDEEEEFVLERFTNALKNQRIGEPEEYEFPEVISGARTARPGFAIDPLGRVYVTYELEGRDIEEEEELIEEREEERKEKKEPKIEEHIVPPCTQHACQVARFGPGEGEAALSEEAEVVNFDPETNTVGVAVDQSVGDQSSGDVYLSHESFVAALLGGGTAIQQGTLIQQFGQAQLTEAGGAGVGVNQASGEIFVADQKNARVDIFEPTKAGSPIVAQDSLLVAEVTAETAELKAAIEPLGADTHAFFRYGTESCSSGPSACSSTAPTPPGIDIGSGFGDQGASEEVTGLQPATKYHFVVVAENSFGVVTSVQEGAFKTLPANAAEAVLPDGRAWELVSPVNKRGVSIEPLSHEGGLIEAANDGKQFAFIAAAPVGDEEPAGNRAPEPTQLIASRGTAGSWATHNITTPNNSAEGIQANTRREYQFFSSDLAQAAVFPIEPLDSTQTTEPSVGIPIYLRDTACATTHCYAPVTKTSTAKQGGPLLGAATPDLEHLGLNTVGEGLFEWSAEEAQAGEGHLRRVDVLPGGGTSTGTSGFGRPEAELFQGSRHTISANGSRVVWATKSAGVEERALYQTEFLAGQTETLQIDEPNGGIEPPAFVRKPVYMASSVSGDRAFFTDNARLTSNASVADEFDGDLYVFERSKPAGERVTDLTPDLNAGESAAVQGGAIGASEDGSYVYFVANGVLAEGALPGHCVSGGLRSAKCNLYEVHNNGSKWESPKLIARLSNEDGPDWGTISEQRTEYKVDEMTSRVSPDGHFLAFMSDQKLTSYNNLDANSEERDEEVYLFDGSTGKLVCASCNPTGAQPKGVHDVQESGEGRGLLVDRLGIWSTETEDDAYAHWIAASVPGWTNLNDRESLYQSRYLSNDGRLFFNAADSLVKKDVNGKEDVYEYEPLGIGDCTSENATAGCVALISSGASERESTFLDASESGNDVFFLTSSSLIPALDADKAFDIYDARVCNGADAEEACPPTALPPATPCEEEGCRANPSSAPSFGPPASAQAGTGNAVQPVPGATTEAQKPAAPKAQVQTRAQKLTAALKTCKRKYKSSEKKRVSCEKQARKKYGAKKATSKGAAHKSSAKSHARGSR
jgi:hypothetical protein